MPTGYTAKLMESGETFESFAMHCARAFGALVMMRDDSMDAPIPVFEPSPYYTKSLAEHKEKHAILESMNSKQRLEYGEAEKAARVRMLEEWLRKDTEQNGRLIKMRDIVKAWTPPTTDHQGLKDFMLEQIGTSMNDLEYINKEITQAKAKTPILYFHDALDAELRGIEYSTQHLKEEIERTNGRNEWVQKLRESLISCAAQAT